MEDGYIRGGGGVGVGAGRVLRVLAVIAVVGLAALSAGLALAAAGSSSRAEELRTKGVPVQVTVTRCLGISSGVGMGIEYWQCRGTYQLAGHTYEEVIGESRSLLETGQVVSAVAVPGKPALLSLRVPATRSGVGPYAASIAVGAATVVLAAGLVWDLKRRSRRNARA